jgi:hypothetical protein
VCESALEYIFKEMSNSWRGYMYLYHGSNVGVITVDYKGGRNTADFGKGFYTTNIKEQAITWAKRMAIEHMGSEYNPDIKAVVTIFDFDTTIFKDAKVKCMRFRGASVAWALFVKNNIQCNNKPKGDHNLNLQYDLVSGYLATPESYALLTNYENGIINKATFKTSLKAIKKTNQYSFHTSKSAEYLKSPVHEYFEVTKEEFNNFNIARNCLELTFFVLKEKNCLCQRKLVFNLADILPLENK